MAQPCLEREHLGRFTRRQGESLTCLKCVPWRKLGTFTRQRWTRWRPWCIVPPQSQSYHQVLQPSFGGQRANALHRHGVCRQENLRRWSQRRLRGQDQSIGRSGPSGELCGASLLPWTNCTLCLSRSSTGTSSQTTYLGLRVLLMVIPVGSLLILA